MSRLNGKVALVTGGASGIGEASVRLFCAHGARCVIADIQDERGQALAAALGDQAIYQRTDVSQEADVAAAVACAISTYGRLDVMFNNAGSTGTTGPISEIPLAEFEQTLAVLLRGPFLGMKHAAAVMQRQGSGSIINTASIAGLRGGMGPHIYAMCKAGVIQLGQSVALEMAVSGVRVNTLCPGVIVTPLATQVLNAAGLPAEQAEALLREGMKGFQPLQRAGESLDIAQAALWLASDESSFVTGQAIVVDGGATAGLQWSQQPDLLTRRPAAR